MTVTPTPNKGLIEITLGTESGTWGPFVNSTTGLLDNALGGTASIPLANSNVILSSAQYQCSFITFTGTLNANVTVTLPAVGSFYTVQNLTTNPAQFPITLATLSGGEVIGVPWGEATDIMTDGTNVKFRNLGRVGTYMDIASQTIPNWITACTVPPYLYCNGAAFDPIAYPVLASFLQQSILPDCRGRTRFSINDGTARINTANGLDGNTLLAGGGSDGVTLTIGELSWALDGDISLAALGGANGFSIDPTPRSSVTPISNRPPAIVSGITMIRAG